MPLLLRVDDARVDVCDVCLLGMLCPLDTSRGTEALRRLFGEPFDATESLELRLGVRKTRAGLGESAEMRPSLTVSAALSCRTDKRSFKLAHRPSEAQL